ncbi:MAG: hypothetical protein HPY66_0663 [Firmicutes bacterium]|nr:hypothetical protein [Bacillota bacterium]
MSISKKTDKKIYKKCNVKTCIHYAGGYCTCCADGCDLYEKNQPQEH